MANLDDTLEGLEKFKSLLGSVSDEIEPVYRRLSVLRQEVEDALQRSDPHTIDFIDDYHKTLSHVVSIDMEELNLFLQRKIQVLEEYLDS